MTAQHPSNVPVLTQDGSCWLVCHSQAEVTFSFAWGLPYESLCSCSHLPLMFPLYMSRLTTKPHSYLCPPRAAAPQFLPMFFLPFVWHFSNLFPTWFESSSWEFFFSFSCSEPSSGSSLHSFLKQVHPVLFCYLFICIWMSDLQIQFVHFFFHCLGFFLCTSFKV
jgi:hypothetical protein